MNFPNPGVVGSLLGLIAAAALLVWASTALLATDGANYKVLVAVWLWLLPVTGAGAAAGYVGGRLTEFAIKRLKSAGAA